MNESMNQEGAAKTYSPGDIIIVRSIGRGGKDGEILLGHVVRVTEGLPIVKFQGWPKHDVQVAVNDEDYHIIDIYKLFNSGQRLRHAINCLIEELESTMSQDEVDGDGKEPSDLTMLMRMKEDHVEELIKGLRDAEQEVWWEDRFLG